MTIGNEQAPKPLIPRLFMWLSIGLYLVSLSQPTFRVDKSRSVAPGFLLLLIGWLGVLEGILAWIANPVLFLTWGLMWFRRRRIDSILTGIAAIGLALSFLWIKTIDVDEAGNRGKIISYGPGYWLWIASMAAAVLSSLLWLAQDWSARLAFGKDPTPPSQDASTP